MAVNSANQVRDRFSVDAWASLADLEQTVAEMREQSSRAKMLPLPWACC
jgi:uncharacterized alpha-E superfamily protein